MKSRFGTAPKYHAASAPFFVTAPELAASFGFTLTDIPEAEKTLADGELVRFGNSALRVIYTPGHAEGSVCFYAEEDNALFTGDVLFRDTIGRTDLPSGDFNLLMDSIRGKLFTLPDDTTVYPGHGPETSIGYEKINNPFIR
jgi:glyoxylase-like metal-dependent hydrolase (beta-lactamase superfamily II)